jgi:3-oxoacyl-[acyl-carrier protein] reductase
MNIDLTGRTAVVPGSSSGLGLAVSRALAAQGANVVMAARRGDVVRREAEQLPSAVGVELDLADPDATDVLVRQAEAAFGQVDIVVPNSGGPPPGTAPAVDQEQLATALHQLLLQHQRLIAAVLPGMRERGWGRITAIGSSGVQQPIPNLALSNIGRAGLAAYLKSLASEVAADGVTVNMVLPGRIDTDRVAVLDRSTAERAGISAEESRRRSEATIPAGRYGSPEEFAAVVAFLASPAASYVTGEQVRCDGGMVRSY